MKRRLVVLCALSTTLVALGTTHAGAALAPLSHSWTPHPIAGFSGRDLGADQPKIDSSLAGTPTAAWFGSLSDDFFLVGGNVLVSTYDGSSWGCPIQLPGTTPPMDGVPPAFDVGADGTVAVAANGWIPNATSRPQPPAEDVWVSIRRHGDSAFTGAGTGHGYPAEDDPVVATSSVRTVAVWISGKKLLGAEFLPGATSAKPVVLATGDQLAFQKVRMDAAGNAVVVFRSIPGDTTLVQNWLTWPAGASPNAAVAFPIESPDDFLEVGAFQVSPTGRMIVAAIDNRFPSERDPSVKLFMGTTTTGFTSDAVIASNDSFPVGGIVAGISDDGDHATVAFRWDPVESTVAMGRLYAVDPTTGAVLSSETFSQPLDYGIAFFKILQQGATAYLSWTDSNLNQNLGGVITFSNGAVTEDMTEKASDWLGLFAAPDGANAYWPGANDALTTTLPHKALNAKPTTTKVSVRRSGAISVSGKVTPNAAASACAGASVALWATNLNKFDPKSAVGTSVVAADGTFAWKIARSDLKGCTKAKVTAYLQTPDGPKPVTTSKTVRCSR